jgi:hypothetical protein
MILSILFLLCILFSLHYINNLINAIRFKKSVNIAYIELILAILWTLFYHFSKNQ